VENTLSDLSDLSDIKEGHGKKDFSSSSVATITTAATTNHLSKTLSDRSYTSDRSDSIQISDMVNPSSHFLNDSK
jgi:hypothetical protein